MTRVQQRWIEQRFNDNGQPLCLIPDCNKVAQKYKVSDKYRNYCENHGWDDMRAYTSWQSLQKKILARDNYTCQKCGDKEMHRKGKWDGYECLVSNLEADHIIEVADGGDMWDEKNLQTLCVRCHKKKTKDNAKLRRLGKCQKPLKEFI